MRLNYIPRLTYPNFDTYGALYNWYAIQNAANITASGWHVPTVAEFATLRTYIGSNGGKLKTTGTTYWNSPNTGATDELGFHARGTGYRDSDGSFIQLKVSSYLRASNNVLGVDSASLDNGSSGFNQGVVTDNQGHCIRLMKDSTSLTHGQTGTYTGNDGKTYSTICIGTQEWMSENLKETLYRDTSIIPIVTDNTAWAALTTGARCSYNNA
ncbi:MAG: FISUMP domain-containing protein [Candidatus Riflemargulisbacteria bacterium]